MIAMLPWSRCFLVCACLSASFGTIRGKELTGVGPACAACQSAAHLLVKARKDMGADKGSLEAAKEIFTKRDSLVCAEDKLKSYADYVGVKVSVMVDKCKSIVPEKFEYKSAQVLKTLLQEKKPRSEVVKLLCVDSGRCNRLWQKEEEPWQNKFQRKTSEEKDSENKADL
eukprot:TRINITY_DN54602_c0_g1_i1.p1 TRINITY_DN54602_c0_g1~~TRINITY_DN54602_c0_g1_i1.p1  ORF type:complete len:170 (-),score=39.73 TRINITY_DN54602_c0_g1_i1:317-826(-)